VRARLVLENDDFRFSLRDALRIHELTQGKLPILFDTYHHECLNSGESLEEAFRLAAATWGTTQEERQRHGYPLVDYSSAHSSGKRGKHADTLDPAHFAATVRELDKVGIPYDVMLEIKDKEISAVKVQALDVYGKCDVAAARAITIRQVSRIVREVDGLPLSSSGEEDEDESMQDPSDDDEDTTALAAAAAAGGRRANASIRTRLQVARASNNSAEEKEAEATVSSAAKRKRAASTTKRKAAPKCKPNRRQQRASSSSSSSSSSGPDPASTTEEQEHEEIPRKRRRVSAASARKGKRT